MNNGLEGKVREEILSVSEEEGRIYITLDIDEFHEHYSSDSSFELGDAHLGYFNWGRTLVTPEARYLSRRLSEATELGKPVDVTVVSSDSIITESYWNSKHVTPTDNYIDAVITNPHYRDINTTYKLAPISGDTGLKPLKNAG